MLGGSDAINSPSRCTEPAVDTEDVSLLHRFIVEAQLPERTGSSKANERPRPPAGGRAGPPWKVRWVTVPLPARSASTHCFAFEFVYVKAAFCVAGFDKA